MTEGEYTKDSTRRCACERVDCAASMSATMHATAESDARDVAHTVKKPAGREGRWESEGRRRGHGQGGECVEWADLTGQSMQAKADVQRGMWVAWWRAREVGDECEPDVLEVD
ncbi:hypothetical protein CLOM_g3804 [Closterium sp. NIES-68]|nr:hypothetical protein CLOM_g3804 [Closterium sp. NIES-68]GJP73765.1 hypothetical protein CLOP_g4452 [Closterium sp. NIES-67]GJP79826.1 hypothetical protein CLOP_g10035 [Closterium sp. NIES-67]